MMHVTGYGHQFNLVCDKIGMDGTTNGCIAVDRVNNPGFTQFIHSAYVGGI